MTQMSAVSHITFLETFYGVLVRGKNHFLGNVSEGSPEDHKELLKTKSENLVKIQEKLLLVPHLDLLNSVCRARYYRTTLDGNPTLFICLGFSRVGLFVRWH